MIRLSLTDEEADVVLEVLAQHLVEEEDDVLRAVASRLCALLEAS